MRQRAIRIFAALLALVLVCALLPAAAPSEPGPDIEEAPVPEATPAPETTAAPTSTPEPAATAEPVPLGDPAGDGPEADTVLPADVPMPIADENGTLDECGFRYDVAGTALTLTGSGMLDLVREDAYPWDNRLIDTVTVAGEVTGIGNTCFSSWTALQSVSLPDSVTSIGTHAFRGCSSLVLTSLPEGLTTIGDEAFASCGSLTHLTLPAGLTTLGSCVFQGCDTLASLTFLGMEAPTLDARAFEGASALERIYVPAGAAGYDAAHGWPEAKIKAGHTVTVEVNDPDGGTASAAPTSAAERTLIQLTVSLNTGYHLARWETVPALAVAADGSFTMPDEDVAVTAVLEKREDPYDYDIFVKILSGSHTQLHVLSTDTVRSVKEQLEKSQGIPVGVQVLTLKEVTLKDDQCLGDCGIIKDSTLHLTLRYAPGGTGTAAEPYLIPDGEQLEAFRYYINTMDPDAGAGKTFKLTADIDLENEPWTPVGDRAKPFQGTFDGGGHTIRGLYINKNGNAGLFGYIGQSGTVKDLAVSGTVTGTVYVGGIAGSNYGTIEGCSNAAAVTGSSSDAGGIAGRMDHESSVVRNCYNTGTVNGATNAGGVVGRIRYGTVENCYNTGTVNATGVNIGGVVGNNAFGAVKNCYNTGAVNSTGVNIGGVAGNNAHTLENCYYLDTCGAHGVGTEMTAEQFASGEVARLLQSGQDALVWGQSLDSDPQPVLTGAAEKQVCRVTLLAPEVPDFAATAYANLGGTLPALATLAPALEGYDFVRWSPAADGTGAAFTASTPVNGDMTLYAVYALSPTASPTPSASPTATPAPTGAPSPSPQASSASPAASAPDTGDESQPALWLALLTLSLAGLVLVKKRYSRPRG